MVIYSNQVMGVSFDYGDLRNDAIFVNTCEKLKANMSKFNETIEKCLKLRENYDQLTTAEKIELDLFLVYSLHALQWTNLKIQGVDLSQHPIKDELLNVKKVMLRWKEVKDKDKRPRVDQRAAKRFVRSGLYNPRDVERNRNKRIKFDD